MTATVVGAYALRPQDEQERTLFDDGVRAAGVDGLEIPDQELLGDLSTLVERLGDMDRSVVTLVPGTMRRMQADPAEGLASTDEDGRRAAVAFCLQARDAIAELNDLRGRASVTAVQVHSAPSLGRGSREALTRSLTELSAADWHGARLVVEHCDAWNPNRTPQKGFLSLADEVRAARNSGCLIGINWGRSAIEGTSADTPRRHLLEAARAGLLGGLTFSGAGEATDRSRAWEDAHLGHAAHEDASLLTSERVRECLDAARTQASLLYVGAKITAPTTASAEARLTMLATLLDEIRTPHDTHAA